MRKIKQAVSTLGVTVFLLLSFIQAMTAQEMKFSLNEASSGLPHIYGKAENADYLYVTAGNRLYCIGNQEGNFPKVGFHVPGQMGGVWQHPIKLLDGFSLNVGKIVTGASYPIVTDSFITYPFSTKFQNHIQGQPLKITQTQFVPDNLPVLVVEYNIQNTSGQDQDVELLLNTNVNLMPVWLGERSGMINQQDTMLTYDNKNFIRYFRDSGNPWFTGIGFENNSANVGELKKSPYADKGITWVSTLACMIPVGKSYNFRFYVSGSMIGTEEIAANILKVRSELSNLFQTKKKRYEVIDKTAEIKLPDSLLMSAYNWGKCLTDWLIREVPGLGEGMSAGLPDYPWFFSNDQASTFMGLVGTIQPDLFYRSFRMLKDISDKANGSCGRIIHEVSSNGIVYDKGRMEESQLHIIAAWQIFNWTGNMEFLKENYAFARKTWDWLQQHDTNHNGYIEGAGGAEIEGLNDEMLDVQVNTYRFLDILSKMAFLFHDTNEAGLYARKSETLKNQINRDWWIDSENRYADFITSKEKALKIIDDALAKRVKKGRNNWAEKKLTGLRDQILHNNYPYKGYVVYYNPSGLQPMEEGMTDTLRAKKMLQGAAFFTNKFGGYITGIERPDDVTIDEVRFQKDTAFTYNRAVMPGVAGGLAQGAVRYGMPDTALMYMHKSLNTFSYATPGTMYEVSPDYGMFVQAWNITGINIPLIQYFFGVKPEAYKKEITLHLQMPAGWEYATLNNLIIGNNRLSVHYIKVKGKVSCTIFSTEPGWKIHFVKDKSMSEFVVNNSRILSGKPVIELTDMDNIIQYTLK